MGEAAMSTARDSIPGAVSRDITEGVALAHRSWANAGVGFVPEGAGLPTVWPTHSAARRGNLRAMKMTSKRTLSGLMFLASLALAAPARPADPTPEEKKKAEERAELEQERARMQAADKAEAARLTPEIHAQARALAEKSYSSGAAALKAAVAGKHRKPGNADRDRYRHPVETLTFLGLRPSMTVLEFAPGSGWYTELLAPALASKGKLLVTTTDPNGPPERRSTFYGQQTKLFLQRLPEAYGKVEVITIDDAAPALGQHDGDIDMILVFRELHGMVQNKRLERWLAAFHQALKPNGILGIEQHRAKPGANPEESAKAGYLPEKWVISQIEGAGFKLAGKSEINANPKDTTDHPEGVWTLPPGYALGDKDRAKYAAIGESDRMTLKFVKVAAKK
jgi:predicted methyltransferase